MAVTKKKLRVAKKPAKKYASKKGGILSTKKRKRKTEFVRENPDSMFDSTVGKTDALFVAKVEELAIQNNNLANNLDPEITEALKEFEEIQNAKVEQEINNKENPPAGGKKEINLDNFEDLNLENKKSESEQKNKKFSWKKLFSFNNKFFSILVGLIFAGIFCTGVYVLAIYGVDEPYPAGNTLNPNCTPGAANCTIIAPVTYTGATTNLNLGAHTLTATQLISTVATGTSPFTVTSNTLVSNLNAELLDGHNSTYFQTAGTYLSSAITSLNGLTGATQTFGVIGTTGTAPGWSSATTVHTLNIPFASASGVTAGLLSNSDFNTFSGKQVALSFANSLQNVANSVNLIGDITAPGNSYYYGTSSTGTKGFYALPSLTGFLTLDQTTPQTVANGYPIFSTGAQLANLKMTAGGGIYPSADSTTAFYINKADNATHIVTVDSTNQRIGINTAPSSASLDVLFNGNIASNGSWIGINWAEASSIPRAYFGYYGANAVVQSIGSKGIAFNVNNNTFGLGTAMSISSVGKVGIGTTVPGALLDLGLAGTTAGVARFEGGTSGYLDVRAASTTTPWTMTLPATAGGNGYFLQTDGSGVLSWASASTSAITSLNGLTGATQTFGTIGTTGTAPSWSSATTVHTLNIPMASASNVTAGLISNSDYITFSNNQPALTGSISGNPNQILVSDNTNSVGSNILLSLPQDISNTSSPQFRAIDITETASIVSLFLRRGPAANAVEIQTASPTDTWTMTLPANAGTSGYVLQTDGTGVTSWAAANAGTVTSVSTAAANNGVTATWANATTTPALTIGLGAITPTSVNGLTLATGTTGFTIAGGTTSKTLTLSGNFTTSGGTAGYNAYWSGTDTLGAEQYVATSRGGLGANMTAAGIGEILYSNSTTTYDHLTAGTSGYVLTAHGAGSAPTWSAAAAGTVTAVSIATANGFSGSSSGGATPVLTIVAGAITPTSVNGLTLATASTGFTIAGGTTSKTLTVTANSTIDQSLATTANPTFASISTTSASTGVQISGASGILTLAGQGNTNNENLTLDFETTANKVAIGSGTGVTDLTTTLKFTAGNIIDSGLTASSFVFTDANKQLVSTSTATLGVANGGLGASMAAGAIGAIPYATSTTAYGTLAAGTATYVLTANGAGAAPSWQAAAAGGITGTGVDNQITTWTGTSTVEGNAGLTYDSSGIGTFSMGTNATDYLTVSSAGFVGISNATPSYPLDVTGTGRFTTSIILDHNASAPSAVAGELYYSSPNLYLYNGSWQTITMSSSLRFKHDIEPLVNDWAKILQVQPVSFIYNNSPDNATNIGYIAEDFDALGLTDLVQYDDKGRPSGINYDKISLYNTEIIKKQQLDINALKTRLGIYTDSSVIVNPAGDSGDGTIAGIEINAFDQSIQSSLYKFGANISGGIMRLNQIFADSLTVKTAKVSGIEMVDSVNGDIYCTWIAAGEMQKEKGNCSDILGLPVTETPVEPPVVEPPVTEPPVIEPATGTATPGDTIPPVEISPDGTVPTPAPADDLMSQQLNSLSQELYEQKKETKKALDQAKKAEQKAELVQEQIKATLNVTSVNAIQDINVAYGTDLVSAKVNLPTSIGVTLSDSSTQPAVIAWDNGMPTYNSNISANYVFSGTLTFIGDITNTDNLMASANIIVAPQPEVVSPVEETISNTTEIIQETTSGLLNGTWNFIKALFGPGFNKLSLMTQPIIKSASAGLMQIPVLVQSFSASLISPIQHIFQKNNPVKTEPAVKKIAEKVITPTVEPKMLKILSTPTGYLNVRETASTTGKAISKAYPNQTYEYTKKVGDWYGIIMRSGKTGWISAEYAEVVNPAK